MAVLPIDLSPQQVLRELREVNQKLARGVAQLADLKEAEIDIGATPKDIVYRQDRLRLYHYHPTVAVERRRPGPFLIVPPLINGHEVADMQADRSLVRNLLAEGIDVYLLDWGVPKPADRYITIDDYIDGYIDDCVEFLCARHQVDSIDLFGICQGGTLSTCYSALYPEKVRALTLTVTPIDFHAGISDERPHVGLLFRFGMGVDVDRMVAAHGNIPAELLNVSFLMAAPFNLNFGKYHDLIDVLDDREALINFLRMEKWLFGGPPAVGEAYRQFVGEFLQQNKLVRGEIEIGGRRVDLRDLGMPVLNIYAEKDHLVPPPGTRALARFIAPERYTEVPIKTGHIGIYTGGSAQKILAPTVARWLRQLA